MRRKALLVAASGPFAGPWINLEKGEWILDIPSLEGVIIQVHSRKEVIPLVVDDTVSVIAISGPARIRALLEEGVKEVFAQAVQLEAEE